MDEKATPIEIAVAFAKFQAHLVDLAQKKVPPNLTTWTLYAQLQAAVFNAYGA